MPDPELMECPRCRYPGYSPEGAEEEPVLPLPSSRNPGVTSDGCPRCSEWTMLCPLCHAPAREERFVAHGAPWTDGKFLPDLRGRPSPMVSCPTCRECYWYSSAGDPSYKPRDLAAHYPPVRVPEAAEYLAWLDRHLAMSLFEEKLIRIHAWWRYNDAHRSGEGGEGLAGSCPTVEDEWRHNLEALWDLLSWNPADRILGYPDVLLIAEIHRELGEFHEARELLETLQVDPFSEPAATRETIEELCDRGSRRVARVDTYRIQRRHLREKIQDFAEEWLEPHPGGRILTHDVEGAYRAWVAQHEEKEPLKDWKIIEALGIFGYPPAGSIRIQGARLRKPIPPGFEVYTQEWRDSFKKWSAEREASGNA